MDFGRSPFLLYQDDFPLLFESTKHKFGKVKEGTPVSFSYYFTNQSSKPVVIQNYRVNCSCTKVFFPKHPIPPGKKDSIYVTFDTKRKLGYQKREIILLLNNGQSITLTFSGNIQPSPETKKLYRQSKTKK
jgi:hypothetical protein